MQKPIDMLRRLRRLAHQLVSCLRRISISIHAHCLPSSPPFFLYTGLARSIDRQVDRYSKILGEIGASEGAEFGHLDCACRPIPKPVESGMLSSGETSARRIPRIRCEMLDRPICREIASVAPRGRRTREIYLVQPTGLGPRESAMTR